MEGPCIEWQGALNNKGYGQVRRKGRTLLAHRVLLADSGVEVPANVVVRHKCDNPRCVNPLHMELGTQSQNMRDHLLRGQRNRQLKLTPAQVLEVRTRLAGGATQAAVARHFNVKPCTVNDIVQGRTWSFLKDTSCPV